MLRNARLTVLTALALSAPMSAQTIHVDDDAPGDPGPGDNTVSDPLEDGTVAHPFDSIQEAIDVAVSGDEVVVQAGSYFEGIDFLGKSITVRSTDPSNDAVVAATTIDGQGSTIHVVQCVTLEPIGTTLAGFSITGGNAVGSGLDGDGGGVLILGGNPTVRRCVFRGNDATQGGAIFNRSLGVARVVIEECTFEDNSGSAVVNERAEIALVNCNFEANSGNGFFSQDAVVSITGCSFARHQRGVFLLDSEAEVRGCTFRENQTGLVSYSDNSGTTPRLILEDSLFEGQTNRGLRNQTRAEIARCEFIDNSSTSNGGGVLCADDDSVYLDSSARFTSCVFSGNSAGGVGGAVYSIDSFGSGLEFINCTFEGNESPFGSVIFAAAFGAGPTVTNSVIWGNGPQPALGTATVFRQSIVQGSNGSGASWNAGIGIDGGGNRDINPRFLAPPTNLALSCLSPAIDAGDNTLLVPTDTLDFNGNPRRVDAPDVPDSGVGSSPLVDLGAFEFQATPQVYCVSNGAIQLTGTQSLTANDTSVVVTGVPNTPGLFFMGTQPRFLSGPACNAGGMLCVGGQVLRLPPTSTASGGSNTRVLDFTDAQDNASAILAGQSWNFQYWYRAASGTCNFSDAIQACFTD